MEIVIRRANTSDLGRISEIALECFPEDYTAPESLHPPLELARQWVTGRDALYPFSLTFIAQENDEIRGYIFYLLLGGVSGVVELEAIGVAAAHRRRGIGKQLMAQTEEKIADHLRRQFGVPLAKIILTTAAGNPDSHHLYQSQGYIPTGNIGPLYWEQEELVYTKDFTNR